MKCEICNKEKIFKEHYFTKETYLGRYFKAWVYTCLCPKLYLEELVYIRDNNKQINTDAIYFMKKTYDDIKILQEKKMDYFEKVKYEDRKSDKYKEYLTYHAEIEDGIKKMKVDIQNKLIAL